MIPLPLYQGKTVGIIGLGRSGMATYHALRASGAAVWLWDDKPAAHDEPLHDYRDWDWNALDALVLSPGVPYAYPAPHPAVMLAREHGVRITCDISLLMEACPDATYVGITGTNGKSTTTTLCAHMLRELGADVEYGGNIGIPALEMEPLGTGGTYVLELSSYQLDIMDTGVLDIACLLNISPDHLDRHGGMEGYIAAKARIFRGQRSHQHAIIATDDEHTRALAEHLPNPICISASRQPSSQYYMEDGWLIDASDTHPARCDLRVIPSLRGSHNHQNAMMAYAACKALGYAGEAIYHAMRTYPGLAHRMEIVATIDHVLFVNDSKATNADAAEKSLATYPQCYWIVGGVAKAGGIAPLAPFFPRLRGVFVIGNTPEQFTPPLDAAGIPYTISHTLERAVQDAFTKARGEQDAVILLAPAAASFDQFTSYEARGDAFKALVATL